MIRNPVIPGMAPDPSILRVGETYYIATSAFHWTPGIPIYKSTDLAHWELIDYGLKKGEVNLQGTNTPAGVWAPHLSYDVKNKRFWLAYSHMVNMTGREFNADNYAIWAEDIHGPWSEPIYLTSIGFDPAIFHGDDGKQYLAILEWETREGYQHPGHIVIAQLDLESGSLLSEWHRVTRGFTTRGCAEAPQIYKRGEYYYLLMAAGGTGYGHGVEIGRAKDVFGPYEPHPSGEPIITSSPRHLFSLGDPDAGQFQMYNPNSVMQKAGHGSLVETQDGEWYIAHLMSRPLKGALLNPLGREASLQKMRWTKEDWLEMNDGSNLAKMETEGMSGRVVDVRNIDNDDIGGIGVDDVGIDDTCSDEASMNDIGTDNIEARQKSYSNITDDFTQSTYSLAFMTPYSEQEEKWVNTKERPGFLRIRGRDSLFSRFNPSIMGTRATSFNYSVETLVEFEPDHYSETAGLGLYYDCNNWLYFHLTYDEKEKSTALTVLQGQYGKRIEYYDNRTIVPSGIVNLRIQYQEGMATLSYRLSEIEEWVIFLENIDVTYLSDEGVNGEPGEIGGATGLFNFIGSVDSHQRDSFADFKYYEVCNT